MKAAVLILRRELSAYFRSYLGYVIIAAVLLIDGLLFNAFALGTGQKKSAEVLHDFFYFSSGTTMVASVFISMRLLAEERQTGTLPLLMSAPVTDAQIVLGKFLSAFLFLAIMTGLTVYMPLLIFVNGSVSVGAIVAGYIGLLLLGAAAVSMGVFASAVAPSQILAAIISAAILVSMLIMWLLGFVTERPLNDVFSYLALWHKHYQPFQDAQVNVRDVIYYVSVCYVFLHLSTRALQARRWR
jgi:ABC-2 type transport system permease protein